MTPNWVRCFQLVRLVGFQFPELALRSVGNFQLNLGIGDIYFPGGKVVGITPIYKPKRCPWEGVQSNLTSSMFINQEFCPGKTVETVLVARPLGLGKTNIHCSWAWKLTMKNATKPYKTPFFLLGHLWRVVFVTTRGRSFNLFWAAPKEECQALSPDAWNPFGKIRVEHAEHWSDTSLPRQNHELATVSNACISQKKFINLQYTALQASQVT